MNRREELEKLFNSESSFEQEDTRPSLESIFNGDAPEPEEDKPSFFSRVGSFLGFGDEKEQDDSPLSAFSDEPKEEKNTILESAKKAASTTIGSALVPGGGLLTSLFSDSAVRKSGRAALQSVADTVFTLIPDAAANLTKQATYQRMPQEEAELTKYLAINKGIPESEINKELLDLAAMEREVNINFNIASMYDSVARKDGEKMNLERGIVSQILDVITNTGASLVTNANDIEERKAGLKALQEKFGITETDLAKASEEQNKEVLRFAENVSDGIEAYRESSMDSLDLANEPTSQYIYRAGGGVTMMAASVGAFALSKNPKTLQVGMPVTFALIDNDDFDKNVENGIYNGLSEGEAKTQTALAASDKRKMTFLTEYVGFGVFFNRFGGGVLKEGLKNGIETLVEETVQNSATNYINEKRLGNDGDITFDEVMEGTIDTILTSLPTAVLGGAIGSYGGFTLQDRADMEKAAAEQREEASQILQDKHGLSKEDADTIISGISEKYSSAINEFIDNVKVEPDAKQETANQFAAEGEVTYTDTVEASTEDLIAQSQQLSLPQPLVEEQLALPEGPQASVLPNNQGTFRQSPVDFDLNQRIDFLVQNKDFAALVQKAKESASIDDFIDGVATIFSNGKNQIEFDNLRNPKNISIKGTKNQLGQVTLSDQTVKIGNVTARPVDSFVNNSSLSNVDVYSKILPLINADGIVVNKIDPVPKGMDFIQLSGDQMVLLNKPNARINPVDILRNTWSKKYFREQVNRVTLGATPVYQKDMGTDSTFETAQAEQNTEQMEQFKKFVETASEALGLKTDIRDSSGGWVDFENGNKQIEPSKIIDLTGRVPMDKIIELAEQIRAEYNQDSVMILDDSFEDKDTLHTISFNDPARGYELSIELMDKFGIGGYTFDHDNATLSTLEFGMAQEIDTFINENINEIKNHEKRENTGYFFQSRETDESGVSDSDEKTERSVEEEKGSDDSGGNEGVGSDTTGNVQEDGSESEVQEPGRKTEDSNPNVDKQKVSRLLERAVEEGIVDGDIELSQYEVANREENIQKAIEFVMESPQQAMDIALGYAKDTSGIKGEYLRLATSEFARNNGDFDIANQILRQTSLDLTEAGQRIQSVSRLGDTSIFGYFKQLQNFKQSGFRFREGGRLENVKNNIFKNGNPSENARIKIKSETKTARSEIISNSAVEGDPFLESLLC